MHRGAGRVRPRLLLGSRLPHSLPFLQAQPPRNSPLQPRRPPPQRRFPLQSLQRPRPHRLAPQRFQNILLLPPLHSSRSTLQHLQGSFPLTFQMLHFVSQQDGRMDYYSF